MDPLKSMKPNKLGDPKLVDGLFITPRIEAIRKFNELTVKEKEIARSKGEKPFEASTVANHLDVLKRFFEFIRSNLVCFFKFFSFSDILWIIG